MSMISRYDPFREAMSLKHAMDQLLAQSFVHPGWGGSSGSLFVPMDVAEDEHGYTVRVNIPGIHPEDIDVTLEQNTLTIKGQHRTEQEREPEQMQSQEQREERERRKTWLLHEITMGSFERSVTFGRPIDADRVETTYEHGVLTLRIPFSQSSRPRKISISGQNRQEQIPVSSNTGD